jgi:putative endonuclease
MPAFAGMTMERGMSKQYYVYILANRKNGTLYVGITSDLPKRISEHKQKTHSGFTKTYDVHRLVYYEAYEDSQTAIAREKAVKAWKRQWKINHIEKKNPDWRDLFETICA